MRNVFSIFKKDMKNLGTNWVAAIIIGGLIILPSLYAWFNIGASWDPYGQTDQVPVGIVNQDDGATVNGNKINAGDELVSTLKKNDDLDWKFTNKKNAMHKLKFGDYYAVIVIPKDFSEKLGTVVKDKQEKASIDYYVNEKINAIAPKITGKGASVIVEQISSKFTATVNGVIFDMFNDIGVELEKNLPDIKKFEDYIFTMEKKMPEIHKLLNESNSDAQEAQKMIHKAQKAIPDVEKMTNNGIATIDETVGYIDKAQKRLDKIAPKIESDLSKAQQVASDVNHYLDTIQSMDLNFADSEQVTNDLSKQMNHSIKQIEVSINQLEQLKKANTVPPDNQDDTTDANVDRNKQIDTAIEQLNLLKENIQNAQEDLPKLKKMLDQKDKNIDQFITNLKNKSGKLSTDIGAFSKEYKQNIEPTIQGKVKETKSMLQNARGMLTDVQKTIPKVSKILNRTGDNLDKGEGMLDSVLGQFPYVNDKVHHLADRIRDIQGETDINKIIDLLKNDPKAEKSFFEEPVKMHENSLFPIPNYGTGMTPFYTVLAFWVGALLLISLLAANVHGLEEVTLRQEYFGKYLTFLTIGFIQSILATLGDLFLLHVNVAAPVWFVVFGLLITAVFMLIVYTLVSVFGDIGKAGAIVLLVLQIAGSGGTYPVVLLPKFFQAINPYLPFTYAIDLMRESVGGIVWSLAIKDIIFLVVFGLIALILGTVLKTPINNLTKGFVAKSKESGLFH